MWCMESLSGTPILLFINLLSVFNVRIRGGLNPSPLGEDLSMVCGYGELS